MAFCRLREGLTDASTASVNPSLGDDDYLPHSLERDRLASVLLRRGGGRSEVQFGRIRFHEAADRLRRSWAACLRCVGCEAALLLL